MTAEEHTKKDEEKKENKNKELKNYVIIGVLVLLVVFSVVQAVQINALRERIDGQVGIATSVPEARQGSSAATSPRGAAPVMVGGC